MKFKIETYVDGWFSQEIGAPRDITCSIYFIDKNGWATEPIYCKKILSNKLYEDEKDFAIETLNEFSAKLRKLLN
jgi:hypothetical protein